MTIKKYRKKTNQAINFSNFSIISSESVIDHYLARNFGKDEQKVRRQLEFIARAPNSNKRNSLIDKLQKELRNIRKKQR